MKKNYTQDELVQKINRLENENLRLRSLLAREFQSRQMLQKAIDKSNLFKQVLTKIFKL